MEAIPNLGSHQLFHEEQDESQEAMRDEAILQDAGVSHRSPPRERHSMSGDVMTTSEFDSLNNNGGGGGGDEGDFSVTFVILEDGDVPAEAAPPPPSAPEERVHEEMTRDGRVREERGREERTREERTREERTREDEEEEEEAEEPQQFKLFENQQGKKLRRKGDREAEGV
jgi:hypothetical protein